MDSRGRRCGGGSLLAITNLMKRFMWGDHMMLPPAVTSQNTSQLVTSKKIRKGRHYNAILAGSFLAGVFLYIGAHYVERRRENHQHKMMEEAIARTMARTKSREEKATADNNLKKVACTGPLKYIGLDGIAEASQLKYFLIDDGSSDTEIIKDVLLVMDEQSNGLEEC